MITLGPSGYIQDFTDHDPWPSGYIHVTWCHISLDSIRSKPSGKNILKKSGTSRPAHLLVKSTFSPTHLKIPSLFAPHFLLDFIFVFLYQVPHKSLRVCCTCTLTGTLKFNSNALFFCYSLIPYTATGYPLFVFLYFSKHEIWQWGKQQCLVRRDMGIR